EMPRCQVDADHRCACLGVLAEVDALSAADVEHVEPGGALVVERSGHPRSVLPAARDQLLGVGARPGLGVNGWPAGLVRPLLDRTLLVVDRHRAHSATEAAPREPLAVCARPTAPPPRS